MADFKYEIKETIGTISESPKGWTKENLDALNEMLDEKLNKGNLSMSSIFGKKK